ncbi:peptidoglycan-binding domain-containing protein [Streptomyces sp. NPDC046876]|uniref:peptidoglycan-binding domain-containing protein n=1 Tax=Streptomyces sp. NPDC046876 TaxID=3155616 RepID=UPI0033D57F7E
MAVRAGVLAATAALAAAGLAGTAQASTGASYVGRGYAEQGDGVWCVQHLANDLARQRGRATVKEDGYWGPKTEAQVRWFQGQFSLNADGIVGPKTGDHLLLWGNWPYGGNGDCMSKIPSSTDHFDIPHTRLD